MGNGLEWGKPGCDESSEENSTKVQAELVSSGTKAVTEGLRGKSGVNRHLEGESMQFSKRIAWRG